MNISHTVKPRLARFNYWSEPDELTAWDPTFMEFIYLSIYLSDDLNCHRKHDSVQMSNTVQALCVYVESKSCKGVNCPPQTAASGAFHRASRMLDSPSWLSSASGLRRRRHQLGKWWWLGRRACMFEGWDGQQEAWVRSAGAQDRRNSVLLCCCFQLNGVIRDGQSPSRGEDLCWV